MYSGPGADPSGSGAAEPGPYDTAPRGFGEVFDAFRAGDFAVAGGEVASGRAFGGRRGVGLGLGRAAGWEGPARDGGSPGSTGGIAAGGAGGARAGAGAAGAGGAAAGGDGGRVGAADGAAAGATGGVGGGTGAAVAAGVDAGAATGAGLPFGRAGSGV